MPSIHAAHAPLGFGFEYNRDNGLGAENKHDFNGGLQHQSAESHCAK